MQTIQPKQLDTAIPPLVFSNTEASKEIPKTFNASNSSSSNPSTKWATYSLPRRSASPFSFKPTATLETSIPLEAPKPLNKASLSKPFQPTPAPQPVKAATESTQPEPTLDTTASNQEAAPAKKPRRKLRARKAAITLSPSAINHLKALLNEPNPKMIRIGVRNRGCSGLTYHLEYVEKPEKFDEEIVQEGVKILIDSKALFSIIGSEMDWIDDKLSTRFVFHNPNIKGECGCGESFMV